MCWNTDNNALGGYVFDHYRSRPYDTTFPNTYPLDDRGSRSYVDPGLECHFSRNSRSGRDMGMGLNVTVMIYGSIGIDNHIFIERRAGLDHSTGHHLCSPIHRCVGRYDCIRMDERGKLESVFELLGEQVSAVTCVAH